MNRRTRIRTGAAAAAVAVGLGVAGAGSAEAAEVTEVGWWTRSPLSSAPEGGFAVGAAPDGPTAVAALRVDLGGGVDTLVLDVVPTSDAGALGSLEVCSAPDTWTAGSAGALDDAPASACADAAVPFGRSGDRWRADVSSLVSGRSGAVTLAVVPVTGSGTVPYEVVFEAPSVVATGATAPTTPTEETPSVGGGGPSAPTPAPAPSSSPAPISRPAITPASPGVSLGGGTTGSPSAPAPPASPAADAQEAADAGADDEASSTIELANSGILDDVAASDPRWGEALVLVLIGIGVGALVYGGSRFSAARA